jgi:hypothetical protein
MPTYASTLSSGARLYIALACRALQSLNLLHFTGGWLRIAQSLPVLPCDGIAPHGIGFAYACLFPAMVGRQSSKGFPEQFDALSRTESSQVFHCIRYFQRVPVQAH